MNGAERRTTRTTISPVWFLSASASECTVLEVVDTDREGCQFGNSGGLRIRFGDALQRVLKCENIIFDGFNI